MVQCSGNEVTEQGAQKKKKQNISINLSSTTFTVADNCALGGGIFARIPQPGESVDDDG